MNTSEKEKAEGLPPVLSRIVGKASSLWMFFSPASNHLIVLGLIS